MSPSTFYRIRLKYAQYGIKGLIPNYAPGAQSAVSQEMYDEFKNLYLKQNAPSAKECVKQLANTYDKMSIPSVQCFRRLLSIYCFECIEMICSCYGDVYHYMSMSL